MARAIPAATAARKILFVAILAFLESTSSSFSQQQSTGGDCSGAFAKIKGDIRVTCYFDDASVPRFRVVYFRLSGLGQSFLANNKLTPEIEAYLAGRHAIVPNEVYDELKFIVSRFGRDIHAEYVAFDGNEVGLNSIAYSEYVKSIDPGVDVVEGLAPSGTGWTTLDSRPVFIPDIQASETLFLTDKWPEGYEFLWWEYNFWNESGSIYGPTIWRYLDPNDLKDYQSRYLEYVGRAEQVAAQPNESAYLEPLTGEFGLVAGEYDFEGIASAVEPIQYFTRNGMPERYAVVIGAPAGHYGYSFTAAPRDLDLVVAVLENVGGSSIELGSFRIKALDDMTIRTHAETQALLEPAVISERILWPAGLLGPGEKLLIPVRMELALDNEFHDADSLRAGEQVRREALSLGPRVSFSDRLEGAPMFDKPTDGLRESVLPEPVEVFEYGPAWFIESFEVNGVVREFREHDPNNFIIYAGLESGSCPYIFSYEPRSGAWLSEGHILLGATSADLKRADERRLRHFSGLIEIREIDDEIAHLDSVALKVVDAEGGIKVYPAKTPPALSSDDGDEIVLLNGGRVEVNFGVSPDAWEGKQVSVVTSGYYLPLADTSLITLRP